MVQDNILYMFFKTKNPITMQGDIAVARSMDNGATWEQLGVALNKDWDLSHPYVFDYNRQVRSFIHFVTLYIKISHQSFRDYT